MHIYVCVSGCVEDIQGIIDTILQSNDWTSSFSNDLNSMC